MDLDASKWDIHDPFVIIGMGTNAIGTEDDCDEWSYGYRGR